MHMFTLCGHFVPHLFSLRWQEVSTWFLVEWHALYWSAYQVDILIVAVKKHSAMSTVTRQEFVICSPLVFISRNYRRPISGRRSWSFCLIEKCTALCYSVSSHDYYAYSYTCKYCDSIQTRPVNDSIRSDRHSHIILIHNLPSNFSNSNW